MVYFSHCAYCTYKVLHFKTCIFYQTLLEQSKLSTVIRSLVIFFLPQNRKVRGVFANILLNYLTPLQGYQARPSDDCSRLLV